MPGGDCQSINDFSQVVVDLLEMGSKSSSSVYNIGNFITETLQALKNPH